MKIALLVTIMLLVSTACFSAITVSWQSDGWVVRAGYTNPNPTSTTVATIPLIATYEIDGVAQTATGTGSITLPTQVTTTKVTYASTATINGSYTLQDVSGDGTAVINSTGKLVFSITAPNDGKEHSIQFKLKSTKTGLIVRIPWLHKWFTSKPVFELAG